MNTVTAILQHLTREASLILRHRQLHQYHTLLTNDLTRLCYEHRHLLKKWYLVSKARLLPEEEMMHICRTYKHLIKLDSLRLTSLPKHVIDSLERKILLSLINYYIGIDNRYCNTESYKRLKYYLSMGQDDISRQKLTKRKIIVSKSDLAFQKKGGSNKN